MPTPIILTLTDAGLNAALDADANGLTLSLTQIAIGSGQYAPLATRTALQTEIARYPLSGGDIEPNSKTLRFSAVIESATTRQAFEIGLFTSTGVLFAVASTTSTDPLILITANIAFVAAFGMVVSEIPAGSLTVVTDPNAPLAIALINQHTAAANPHAQYAMKAAFDSHVTQNAQEHDTFITVEDGNLRWTTRLAYDTLVTYNAQNQNNIVAMIQSVHRRVESLEMREEVQIGGFIITDDPRNPVLYKGYGEWRLVPDTMLSGLDLGGITGQVAQIASGTDRNVRTTFFWRRIDPTAVMPLRTISISADSTDVNLLALFTATYGAPVIGERVHFVVESGVLVTATTTNDYAIVTGNWPRDSVVSMDVLGIVAGRGGRGGTGIGETTPPEAKHGFDGGPAILATYPLVLNNLNTVAGGGAGGGASANWRATQGTGSAHIGNVGGSGGAPYGGAGDLGVVNAGIINWGAGLPGIAGERTTGGAAVTRTETRIGSTLIHIGGTGGGLGQNGGMGSGNGSRTGGNFYPNEWRAGGVGGLAGVAITGLVTVTGNPVLGR